MSGYDILALTIGVITAGAAWAAWLSPWARARRLAVRLQIEFHQDWNGDKRPGVNRPGVMERLAALESALQAPILNGRGEKMIDTIDLLAKRTERNGRRLTALERIAKRHEENLHRMDQRIEDRFAEQLVTLSDVLIEQPGGVD